MTFGGSGTLLSLAPVWVRWQVNVVADDSLSDVLNLLLSGSQCRAETEEPNEHEMRAEIARQERLRFLCRQGGVTY